MNPKLNLMKKHYKTFGEKSFAARVVLHSILQLFSEKSCIETEITPKPSTKRL